VSDALLRAVNATFQASWIKLIYVAMMALGTWYALPYGVQYVGLAIALSTAVHFLMGAWMGQKMIGGSLGEVLVITRYAWGIGVIVALEQWGVVCCFSSQPLIAAVVGLVALILTMVLIIWKKKEWLGTNDVNPIQFLPERIRTKFKLN
jgi:hypothetical protein